MNDPFVIEQSKVWAKEEIQAAHGTPEEQILAMYEKAIGRKPESSEVTKLKTFLDQQAGEYGKLDERAWADVAHVLFNAKDFIYLN